MDPQRFAEATLSQFARALHRIRQIDSFDQWDVELGKVLAEKHHPGTRECLMNHN